VLVPRDFRSLAAQAPGRVERILRPHHCFRYHAVECIR
jgi:hypothetical protein